MGRITGPVAGWPGDVAVGPHLLRVIRDVRSMSDWFSVMPCRLNRGTYQPQEYSPSRRGPRVRDGPQRSATRQTQWAEQPFQPYFYSLNAPETQAILHT